MVGGTIGHYRIVQRLAAGGMGVIYRADDLTLHRPVALKFLSHDTALDEEYRARFLREARVAAALNHPNTCTVYEVGQVESTSELDSAEPVAPRGTPFIAMEFIEGETLASRLAMVGRLDPRETLDVASQVVEGLAAAHARGIVHRDLKPQNIMIASGGLVKIVDFGLAKPSQTARGASPLVNTTDMISADLGDGTIIGTCAYMSPEQASSGKVDARSDIFSFGTILYQMLSGRLPFRGDTATVVLAKILEADPDPLEHGADPLFAALARVAGRCLQKGAENRYPHVRSLLEDLKEIRTVLSPAPSPRTGFVTRIGFALLGVVLAAAVLIYARVARTTTAGTASRGGEDAVLGVERAASGSGSPERNAPAPSRNSTVSPGSDPAVRKPVATGNVLHQQDETTNSRAAEQVLRSTNPRGNPAFRPDPAPTNADVPRLILDSEPKASVSLDGSLVGITPLTVDTAPGTHELVMTTPDGLRWRGRVEVPAGGDARVERNLTASGQLTITSDVWLEVSLDGGPAEQTPVHFSRVSAGLHELRAFRGGFVTQTREIVIEEGKTSHVRLKLEKKP